MHVTKSPGSGSQLELFRTRLDSIIDMEHELVVLGSEINWQVFEEEFAMTLCEDNGRPALSIRLMVGLQYLKYLFNVSDESVVERFKENPYWQYFCGLDFFEHDLPCHPTSLVKWRKRIGIGGAEKLLKETLELARRSGFVEEPELSEVNIDTTVQPKNIIYPTDARLLNTARKALVRAAKQECIPLRQSYTRLGGKAYSSFVRENHRKDKKKSRKLKRKLKTYLGRVIRDIDRRCPEPSENMKYILGIARKLWQQKPGSKNKIYSIHAPEVKCIAKGKVHKKYEFGSKVSIATSTRKHWVVGVNSFPSNPFDGHTIPDVLCQIKKMTGEFPKAAFCDRGYKGSEGFVYSTHVYHQGQYKSIKDDRIKKKLRKRSSIEAIIGHMKNDHRMNCNRLLGSLGDQFNALLAGCGFNLRKWLRELLFCIYAWIYNRMYSSYRIAGAEIT
jgi:transposase, IS5 family